MKAIAGTDFQIKKIKAADDDPFARQKLIKDWDQEKVKNAKILVVGAGALGNEVLKNLALLGVGNILIIDFDTISKSNLSRTVLYKDTDRAKDKAQVAADRTKKLCVEKSADVNFISGNLLYDVGDGIYSHFDVVIGCTDNLEARMAMSRGCWLAGIPWVDGSISGYNGNVIIFKPFESFCFICTMSTQDLKDIKKRYSCDDRRRRAFAENKIPTIQTLSSIIAGMQVHEALRLIHKDYSMAGKRIRFNAEHNILEATTSAPLANHQIHHGTYIEQQIEKLSWASSMTKLIDFMDQTGLIEDDLQIILPDRPDHDFVLFADCQKCGHKEEIYRPLYEIFADQFNKCQSCGVEQPSNPVDPGTLSIKFDKVASLSRNIFNQKILEMSLREVGFAPLDIVTVKVDNKFFYYELSADLSSIFPKKDKEMSHG